LGWLFFLSWVGSVWVVYESAHYFVSDRPVPEVKFLAGIFILPIVFTLCFERLKRYLLARFFAPRFGSAIKAKHQKLRLKYPLAYN
jgi:hypothetical protein